MWENELSKSHNGEKTLLQKIWKLELKYNSRETISVRNPTMKWLSKTDTCPQKIFMVHLQKTLESRHGNGKKIQWKKYESVWKTAEKIIITVVLCELKDWNMSGTEILK